jgi:general secretion pathway protein L
VIERVLRELFMWWFSELRALIPVSIWKFVPKRPELLGVLQHAEFALFETSRDRKSLLLRVTHAAYEVNPDVVQILSRLQAHKQRVRLCLSSELGLTKLIELPIAAINDLEQLLRFEMDRLSPFPVDEVRFAHRILHVDKKERRISVVVQIVPRNIVKHALATCECLGLQPGRLELAGAPGDNLPNLLAHHTMRYPRVGYLDCGLALLALLFAGLLVLGPLHKREAAALRLEHEIVVEKAGAERSAALRQQLDLLTSTMGPVIGRRQRGPMCTLLLAELTRLMPDDTYAVELRIGEGHIMMLGYAQAASNLIGLLDATPLFGEVKFLSPVTRDQQTGREFFQIAIALEDNWVR